MTQVCLRRSPRSEPMLGTILIIVLILLLLGGLPTMPYAANWGAGYYPSGILGILLIIVIVLLLTGRL